MCAVASEAIADGAETVQAGMLAHLHGVVAGIDAEHLHTRDHSENVAAYAMAIGRALGFDTDKIVRLHRAALLHDIGKLAVRQEILVKPSSLTDAEYDEMKLHSNVGASMLLHAGLTEEACWVRHHHERMDGRGYPDGLAGDAIPAIARIVAVAETYDTLTAEDTYRTKMTSFEALTELRRVAGRQLDPGYVEALGRLLAGRGLDYRHADAADFDRELAMEERIANSIAPATGAEGVA
jgi:putative nucleotidyltransferase with HDIG domain